MKYAFNSKDVSYTCCIRHVIYMHNKTEERVSKGSTDKQSIWVGFCRS